MSREHNVATWTRALRGEFCADFLDHHGKLFGVTPTPPVDDRLDLGLFQREKTIAFRERVEAYYRDMFGQDVVVAGGDPEATRRALRAGTPIIARAHLRGGGWYHRAFPLLVLAKWLPRLVDEPPAGFAPPAHPREYRAVDVRYLKLHPRKDGQLPLSASRLPLHATLCLVEHLISDMNDGIAPRESYVLGRSSPRFCSAVARVQESAPRLRLLQRALAWRADLLARDPEEMLRTDPRVRTGVTPEWREAAELLCPPLSPTHSAEETDLDPPARGEGSELLSALPSGKWLEPRPVEWYVDFESVNDGDDDFATFPKTGGTSIIFMIGVVRVEGDDCTYRSFTAETLSRAEERRIMRDFCRALAQDPADTPLFHWSRAEVVEWQRSAARYPSDAWPALRWLDLEAEGFKKTGIRVRGVRSTGLKAISKALHRAGAVATTWEKGPCNGQGAMVGAWWCGRRAREEGRPMLDVVRHGDDVPLMRQIERYNRVDCQAMVEIAQYMRRLRREAFPKPL